METTNVSMEDGKMTRQDTLSMYDDLVSQGHAPTTARQIVKDLYKAFDVSDTLDAVKALLPKPESNHNKDIIKWALYLQLCNIALTISLFINLYHYLGK